MAFLKEEYTYIGIFALGFTVLIFFALNGHHNEGLYRAVSFLAGAFTSSLCAYLGMSIATIGNVRTTVESRADLSRGFSVAFNSGAVMGFGLIGLAIFGLISIILIFFQLVPENEHAAAFIMEVVTGYGLGGSSVALFGRVGGGIFTKAADVGADLVGKVEAGIPEDDPRNPAVIADNVGDNVGDIAGMGSDLFGSFAEATCAALVIGAVAFGNNFNALLYPLVISAVGVPVCLLTAFFARLKPGATNVEGVLKNQLYISTFLMSVAMYFVTKATFPESFVLEGKTITQTGILISLFSGLWSGLAVGIITEYYTSHSYSPVREIAEASKTGSATNIIYGLSLGYKSSVAPVLLLSITTFLSWHYAGMYGIAIAAIGMISTIAVGLTIDAYGPVSDNAGGIAEMAELEKTVRERTDILDAAGNTTAAIGKGFAIGSALLTALALFAAFLTTSGLSSLNILNPLVFTGLMVGAMLPFFFTAMTMLGVGRAAFSMIEEVRHQFRSIPGIMKGEAKPDYKKCVAISTDAALKEMIHPAMLVLGTPLLFGILFGVEALAGLLAGALVSGLVMALSQSNSGGAWDNAKKYIETGKHGGKGSECHKAAVVGDTVGDPLKDTSGPSLNILMKLMAIVSLVFGPFIIKAHAGLMSMIFGG